MKDYNGKNSLFYVLIAYALLTCGTMWLHARVIERPQEGMRRALHAQVLENRAGAPTQYRFLVFYAAEGLQRAGVPFDWSYLIIRGLFTFLAAAAFHFFLLRWFRPVGAFAAVLFFFAVLPSTYFQYFMQPQDMVNLFLFIAGLMLIRDRRDALLAPLLFIAMLNRETAVLLVFVYLFYRYDELPLGTLLLRGGAFFLVCAGTYAGLRAVFGPHEYEFTDFIFLEENTLTFMSYASVALVPGVFIAAAWKSLARRPKFLARAVLLTPFFFIIHWTSTRMWEPRLLLPLLPVLVPLGLISIFGEDSGILAAPDAPRLDPTPAPPPAGHFASRHPRAALAILSAGFIALFSFFCWFNVQSHLGERRARLLINQAAAAQKNGDTASATDLLLKAVESDPGFAQAHLSLAIIYLDSGKPALAARHFRIALDLEPDGPYADRIRRQLAALAPRR